MCRVADQIAATATVVVKATATAVSPASDESAPTTRLVTDCFKRRDAHSDLTDEGQMPGPLDM
jgi:hypothetical protein